jgi:aspartate-semialdehyde dehydrogenase
METFPPPQCSHDHEPPTNIMSNGYRVAIVGATGVVGQTLLRVLEERRATFPVSELVPFASERSVASGRSISFREHEVPCRVLELDAVRDFDLVFSSAGGDISRQWAPRFAEQGAIVIDKSSAFRARPEDVPLVVPEVNPHDVDLAVSEAGCGIIASPNCSTTQLVVALKPLHQVAKIRRLVIATYQAVSGTGARALEELDMQSRAILAEPTLDERDIPAHGVYPHPIAFNTLAQAGDFIGEGRTDEEQKLVLETRRILDDQTIRISATCVRVPVRTCHSEAVNVEFHKPLGAEHARELLEQAPGVIVLDDPASESYPTPLQAADNDEVFVGRIRCDPSHDRALDLWIVADNLRKGAATNAVQIAELLHRNGMLPPSQRHRAVGEPFHA